MSATPATPATTAATAATTAANAAIAATAAVRPARRAAAPGPLAVTLGVLSFVAVLWLVMRLYAGGQPLVALGVLAFGSAGVIVYATSASLAWRYLFPGIAGMLLFVAFPLFYTVGIGFTNYSSAHLLDHERARQYFLEQTITDDAHSFDSRVHAAGDGRWRLVLAARDGGPGWVSPAWTAAVPAAEGAAAAPLPLQPLPPSAADLGPALDLRQTLALRERLMSLVVQAPGGPALRYAGVREFAPLEPLWREQADGSLLQAGSGQRLHPDRQRGFYVTASGEPVTPGWRVGIGWAHYSRMLFDADFRGPFVAIFTWTVVFAGLTVLFAGSLGLVLAVLLEWQALPHRTLYRTLLFLPYAVPGFISILVFKGLFNQNFGEINAILHALSGIRPAWFADPLLAKMMLLLVNTWLGFPYFMILCAGLIKAIPSDLYEASALAGAGPLTNLTRITAPLILKPLTPLLISAFAFNFNNFVLIALLTDGRPDFLDTKLPAGTNDILVSYTYRIAFTDAGQNFGLAAAISTLIFVVVALLALLQLKATQRAGPSGQGRT